MILQASNGQKINSYDMEILDTAFAQMVKEHKSTIYTVCFMFSKDSDEVSDLFKKYLSIFGKDMILLRISVTSIPGFGK